MSPKQLEYQLRDATDNDYSFVEGLYIETMCPLLSALGAWDHQRNLTRFKNTFYNLDEAKIIVVDDRDVGWLQIHEDQAEIALLQFHIEKKLRSKGIGTRIIKHILRRASDQNKHVTLSVVKGNRALMLYRRLGLFIVGEDDTKFHMSTTQNLLN